MTADIFIADYADLQQAADIGYLMNCYSEDPMGADAPLPADIRDGLAAALLQVPRAFSVLCYVGGKPAGLVNCFEGFSTFKCKPLINVHDVIVLSGFRGQGVSHLMLDKVEECARDRGCCKITLEVLEGNIPAQKSYSKLGYAGYELDPKMGKAMFWQKPLDDS